MSTTQESIRLTAQLQSAFVRSRAKMHRYKDRIAQEQIRRGIILVFILLGFVAVSVGLTRQNIATDDLRWTVLSISIGLLSIAIGAFDTSKRLQKMIWLRDRHCEHAEQILVLLYRVRFSNNLHEIELQLHLLQGQQIEISVLDNYPPCSIGEAHYAQMSENEINHLVCEAGSGLGS